MKSIVWLVAGLIGGSLFGSLAMAQPNLLATPAASLPGVSLAAAVDAAWQRAVEASEAQGQRQRADAERVAAGSLWAA
ncbi:MAG: TolC family protein, partial [Burkholderiales bacterium]|nr:TolC family protein [Burkholderiales bacterium]